MITSVCARTKPFDVLKKHHHNAVRFHSFYFVFTFLYFLFSLIRPNDNIIYINETNEQHCEMLFGAIKSTLSVWRCALERERVHRLVYLDGFFYLQQQQVASKVFSFKCFGDGIFWCHFIRLNTCAIACINFARPFVVANVGNSSVYSRSITIFHGKFRCVRSFVRLYFFGSFVFTHKNLCGIW